MAAQAAAGAGVQYGSRTDDHSAGLRQRGGITIHAVAAMILAFLVPWSSDLFGQCIGTEFAQLLASDEVEGDSFGWSVAISGNVAVVGAPWVDDQGEHSGAAYVFRSDGLVWHEEAKLLPADGDAGDVFGVPVAICDDTIVIAATGDEYRSGYNGSAYVFSYDGSSWIERQKLVPASGEEDFGFGIAVTEDFIVVGARGEDTYATDSGSAYVYLHDGASWIETARLKASDAEQGAGLGGAVAASGNLIALSARGDDTHGNSSGAVYVFRFQSGEWTEEAKITASDGDEYDRFGNALALCDDTLVVGAYHDDENGDNSGSVYVFGHDGQNWVQQQKLLLSGGQPDDRFGISVVLSDEMMVVGASGADYLGSGTGLVVVYRFDGSQWLQLVKLRASNGGDGDQFGHSVAAEAGCVLSGGSHNDAQGDDAGAAYIYAGFADCNDNGTIDLCDVADGTSLDCQPNGLPDECDLADGTSEDVNANGIPDECEDICPADFDADGQVDTTDLLYLLSAWATPDGDVDGDGDTDTADLLALLATWGDCPPCIWDFNDDGVVDDLDRDILMEHWGDCPDPPDECPWDMNGDGLVNGLDLMELLEHYGPC